MTINDVQDEIVSEFAFFETRDDSYNYIIELGKNLSPMPEGYHSDQNLIAGCQSKVWVKPELAHGAIVFFADSDSTLVKGLVSMLVRILSGRTPDEILEADLYFMEKMGLKAMLSMNRANGLASMLKQIKMYALAYKAKLS
jgi:cysteine desulfuration protein SufE